MVYVDFPNGQAFYKILFKRVTFNYPENMASADESSLAFTQELLMMLYILHVIFGNIFAYNLTMVKHIFCICFNVYICFEVELTGSCLVLFF